MPEKLQDSSLQEKKKQLVVDFREISLRGSSIYTGQGVPDYNPDALASQKGLEIYSRMREDDQIKAVLTMKKFARLMTPWEIQPASDDAMDIEIAEFVRTNFDNIAGTFEDVLLGIYTALDYGYSLSEKVWCRIDKGKYVGKIGLKSIKTREPFYYQFESDPFGNLLEDGIIYTGPTPLGLLATQKTVQQQAIENTLPAKNIYMYGQRLPVNKFIIYSYNKEFSNWYGRSDLRAAYRSWWSKELLVRFMNIYMERFGMATTIAKFPKGTSKGDKELLKQALDKVQSKYSMVIPEDVQVELLQAGGGGENAYKSAIEMHNRFISRSILVPDLMGFNEMGGGGAYALGKKHFDVFLWILEKLGRDTEESIVGEQIIKQLVDYNYSNVTEYPKFKFESITAEGTAVRANIVQMGITGGYINPLESWVRSYLALPAIDKENPPMGQQVGMPQGLEAIMGGGEKKPELGELSEEEQKEAIESGEGMKDVEDKLNDAMKPKQEGEKKFASTLPIDQLKMNPEQSKIIDHQKVQSIKARIDAGEELCPITIDGNNNVIDGHHRLTAYKLARRKEVPVQKFAKPTKLPEDKRFDYKVDFAKIASDLDDFEKESVDALSDVVKSMKDTFLRQVERKGIIENKDYKAINALQLRYVGDFKKELEQRLVKLYLDSKLKVLRELQDGGEDIEITTKFAAAEVLQPWIPVPPTEAIEFFNRKVLAKIILADGVKKLLTLAVPKELRYYDAKAFAIAGIERDFILKMAKMILLDGLKTGASAKDVMFGLGKLFDSYLTTGEIVDDELVTPHRLETIVRTNYSEAYNAGRKAMFEDPDIEGVVPYVQYKAIMDDRVRPTHAEMHNLIFSMDDPIVDRIWPPNGFNCRCMMTPITSYEIEQLKDKEEGVEVATEADVPADFPDEGFGKYTSSIDVLVVNTDNEVAELEVKLKNVNEEVSKFSLESKILQDRIDALRNGNDSKPAPNGSALDVLKSVNENANNPIVRCPYVGCTSDDIKVTGVDEFATIQYVCNKCLNTFKVTKEGEIFLFDKIKNEWIKQQERVRPDNPEYVQ